MYFSVVDSLRGCGGLVVTFATARMPRSQVQTPAMAEIWIEVYPPCAPLFHLTTSGKRASPKPKNLETSLGTHLKSE